MTTPAAPISWFAIWQPGYGGATVEIVKAGTTTRAVVYTDYLLTMAADNPQLLGSRTVDGTAHGKFVRPIYCPEPYDLIVNGESRVGIVRPALVSLKDEIANAAVATTNRGRRYRRLQDRFDDVVHAEDFGLLGDSSATNTGTINAAIGAASSQGGGAVIIPAGTHTITTLTIPQNVRLVGESRAGTVLQSEEAQAVVTLSGDRAGLEQLTLDGISLIASSIGVYSKANNQTVFRDVQIKRFDTGMRFYGGRHGAWRDLHIDNCAIGAELRGDTDASGGADGDGGNSGSAAAGGGEAGGGGADRGGHPGQGHGAMGSGDGHDSLGAATGRGPNHGPPGTGGPSGYNYDRYTKTPTKDALAKPSLHNALSVAGALAPGPAGKALGVGAALTDPKAKERGFLENVGAALGLEGPLDAARSVPGIDEEEDLKDPIDRAKRDMGDQLDGGWIGRTVGRGLMGQLGLGDHVDAGEEAAAAAAAKSAIEAKGPQGPDAVARDIADTGERAAAAQGAVNKAGRGMDMNTAVNAGLAARDRLSRDDVAGQLDSYGLSMDDQGNFSAEPSFNTTHGFNRDHHFDGGTREANEANEAQRLLMARRADRPAAVAAASPTSTAGFSPRAPRHAIPRLKRYGHTASGF